MLVILGSKVSAQVGGFRTSCPVLTKYLCLKLHLNIILISENSQENTQNMNGKCIRKIYFFIFFLGGEG